MREIPGELMRCFVEIDIPKSIKDYLSGKAERIKSLERPDDAYTVNITKEENLHVTVAFLGEINEKRTEEVIKKLSKIAGNYKPFECTLSKIEAIPKKSPRVIWVSLDESNTLSKLTEEIKQALMLKSEDRKFAPHITIARVKTKRFNKSTRNLPVLMDLFNNLKIEPLKFEVREIKIMQSILKKEGPEYVLIKSILLESNK